MKRSVFLCAPLVAAACALPESQTPVIDGTLFQSTRDPAQYRSPLPRDVKPAAPTERQAHGESCRTSVFFPPLPPAVFLGSNVPLAYLPYNNLQVLLGDEGYAHAVARARASVDGAQLVDVHADVHVVSVLGLWRRECIEVHATSVR